MLSVISTPQVTGVDLSLLSSVMTPEANLREVRSVYEYILVVSELHVFFAKNND